MNRSATRALFLPVLATLAPAQDAPERVATPPQRFFDWTEVAFPAAELQARRAQMIAALRESGGGVFLTAAAEGTSSGATFRQHPDFAYFTGLELPRSALAIDADREVVTLFVPGTDRRFASPARRNDFPGRRLARDPELPRRSGIDDIQVLSALPAALAQWQADGRTVRVNAGRAGAVPAVEVDPFERWRPGDALLHWLQHRYPDLALGNAFAAVARLRMVKSPAEIARLRRAAEITAESLTETARAVADGVDERTLEGILERGFKARGAARVAFDSIIKSGPNSLWPWRILAAHSDRRNRALRAGELVIFDVGCEFEGYAADVGRTLPVSGTFTAAQEQRLRMATAVADAILAAVRPGVTLRELQQVAHRAIPAAERRYMQTGLFFGHHIGLEVGDPTLADRPLAAGMVFTVEPWYYNHVEEIAVFVEDMVLVTADGAVNLSASLPRAPDALAALVGTGSRKAP